MGPDFLITLAPVATALLPDPNVPPHLRPPRPLLARGPVPNPLHPSLPHLSGFSYAELECSAAGREVAWYNAQFYCGWGDAGSTAWYDAVVAAGWAPRRVVLGVVTNPGNGAGHVGLKRLREVCGALRDKHGAAGGFGGVMGWEYFNGGDGGEDGAHVHELELGTETPRAGWVAALGRVLRTEEAPFVHNNALLGISPEQLRRMVAPPPRKTWAEESVQQLVVLGFEHKEAVAALDATDGNVELAAGFLFEQYPG